MRVLVTGSAGFIGSWLADELVKHKHDVLGLDNLSGGYLKNTKGHQFIPCELADKWNAERKIKRFKPEVLYHLAASAREIGSLFEPARSTQDNAMAYANTINACIKAGCLKKVVLFSSMAIYGAQTPPFSELMIPRPEDIYGYNKAFMEQMTITLSEIHDFKWVILRPHNVIGPRQNLSDRYRNVFAIWMNKIMRGDKEIHIFGDGQQMRAFSPIEFSLPCYIRCLDEDIKGIYNIGGIHHISLLEAAQLVLMVMRTEGRVSIVHLPGRPNEVKYAFCDCTRAIDKLGYKENRSLIDCLQDMAEWAKAMGPQEWTQEKLELANDKMPEIWR